MYATLPLIKIYPPPPLSTPPSSSSLSKISSMLFWRQKLNVLNVSPASDGAPYRRRDSLRPRRVALPSAAVESMVVVVAGNIISRISFIDEYELWRARLLEWGTISPLGLMMKILPSATPTV